MLIRSEFTIEFQIPHPAAIIAMLRLHPSLDRARLGPEYLRIEHIGWDFSRNIMGEEFNDGFGNRCTRFVAPQGGLRLTGSSTVHNSGVGDLIKTEAIQHNIEDLPTDVLPYLLSSRYCPVDTLSQVAGEMFGHTSPGWARAIWIRDWVHNAVQFDYAKARPTKTALDVFTERTGVCRDFQHLAITMTRAMNIPARYVTGYLGDIRRPGNGSPGDFSAWYQVFLDDQWWDMDARHNDGRLGRTLMATGRDATDVAITTSFGAANLNYFYVKSFEVDEEGAPVPLPEIGS
ncbi:Transglutaminase-like enzyme, putative cysteine protease [Granulicella rosea]|uniref:Transglutaminase-like enzyme, putative cysteine protease n=1 Tax=Granulicella rosea TaxID=474952 RepID=A0A239L6W5_9BACT|nr:transglutaminase family protein [Granulicella rosea]SNT26347.1 Transglutaminase-like enzyme, putative cysteine protease [Granulicella rosea]